jgi:hypothetical protein
MCTRKHSLPHHPSVRTTRSYHPESDLARYRLGHILKRPSMPSKADAKEWADTFVKPNTTEDDKVALTASYYPLKRFKRAPWTRERRRDRFREGKQRLGCAHGRTSKRKVYHRQQVRGGAPRDGRQKVLHET